MGATKETKTLPVSRNGGFNKSRGNAGNGRETERWLVLRLQQTYYFTTAETLTKWWRERMLRESQFLAGAIFFLVGRRNMSAPLASTWQTAKAMTLITINCHFTQRTSYGG